MLDRVASEDDRVTDVASVYDAARARARPEPPSEEEVGSTPLMPDMTVESYEMRILPVALSGAVGGGPVAAAPDWSATVDLVERAAATIRAYERRFVQLDLHTRALMERASEEQSRLQEQVIALEQRLHDSEERANRAETATRDEAFFRWEAERRLREAETRLLEAEDQSRVSEDYLRRVHSVLADL